MVKQSAVQLGKY